MIAVIADDFTGAAEMAGIAWRYGYSVSLMLHDIRQSDADVIVLCTDSRSLSKEKALAVTKEVTEAVLKLQPEWVYKKTDSVLRGYVVEELLLQMEILGLPRAFILSANPSMGRTISGGEYYVQGEKIHTTGFANDPEFPVRHSAVSEMLQREALVLSGNAILPAKGIVAGEAADKEAVERWAARLDDQWLLAGAGDFFEALLGRNAKVQRHAGTEMKHPYLYISGTAFEQRKTFLKEWKTNGGPVIWMPDRITDVWLEEAAAILRKSEKLVLAIDHSTETAAELRTKMASTAHALIRFTGVNELFIEGGSTAAAMLQELQINHLEPVEEWQRGVTRMKAGNYFITVKPGSYPLPERLYK